MIMMIIIIIMKEEMFLCVDKRIVQFYHLQLCHARHQPGRDLKQRRSQVKSKWDKTDILVLKRSRLEP